MKVQELIEKLQELNPEANIVVEVSNNDGCEGSGYGATSSNFDVTGIIDLETRIVLDVDY
jgi:hypothetical protein